MLHEQLMNMLMPVRDIIQQPLLFHISQIRSGDKKYETNYCLESPKMIGKHFPSQDLVIVFC